MSPVPGQPEGWAAHSPPPRAAPKRHAQPGDRVYDSWQRCHPWAMLKSGLAPTSSAETLPPLRDPLAGNDTALFGGGVTVCTTLGSAMT